MKNYLINVKYEHCGKICENYANYTMIEIHLVYLTHNLGMSATFELSARQPCSLNDSQLRAKRGCGPFRRRRRNSGKAQRSFGLPFLVVCFPFSPVLDFLSKINTLFPKKATYVGNLILCHLFKECQYKGDRNVLIPFLLWLEPIALSFIPEVYAEDMRKYVTKLKKRYARNTHFAVYWLFARIWHMTFSYGDALI